MDKTDFLSFFTDKELVAFFSQSKTTMSCVENPNIFLNQLYDHKLIPKDLYQEVIEMSNERTKKSGLYKILEGVEKNGGRSVTSFWKCMFQDHIHQNCPKIYTLRKKLLDRHKSSAEQPHWNNEKEPNQTDGATMRKEMDKETDKEKPGTSSGSSSKGQPTKLLPVTCNKKKGVLHPDKLAKGDQCILSENIWYTPPEFEKVSGKESCKNWKTSIIYRKKPLKKLFTNGRLKCRRSFRGRCKEKKQTV